MFVLVLGLSFLGEVWALIRQRRSGRCTIEDSVRRCRSGPPLLLLLMLTLWVSGRSNPDDVIGLLEQMLAIALGLVVLFIGHRGLPLEILVLVFALRLPAAGRNHPVMERTQGSKDVLMPF